LLGLAARKVDLAGVHVSLHQKPLDFWYPGENWISNLSGDVLTTPEGKKNHHEKICRDEKK
jgi:hypothetical protein